MAQGHQKPYPGAPISTPGSSGLNVAANVADVNVKRITPIPMSLPLSEPSFPAIQKSPEEIQRGTTELIQRLENEKKRQEELAKEYRKRNVFDRPKEQTEHVQMAQHVIGAKVDEEQTTSHTTSQDSGVIRPTIGETTISSEQAEIIRDEVCSTLRKVFPGIAQIGTYSSPLNRGSESGQPGTKTATVIDLSGSS